MFDPYPSLHRAESYRRAPRGYYVVRSLLVWGGVFGAFVGLYRNDVLRELSRKIGQESRYLAAESQLIGTPGWGTPRSMEPVLGGGPAAAAVPATTPERAAAPAAPVVETPAPVSVPAAPAKVVAAVAPVAAAPLPAPAAPAPVAATTESEQLVPVSLDSLPLASNAPRTPSSEEPAPRAATPAPPTNVKSVKPASDDARAPAKLAKAPPKPAAPAAPKATQARASDNPLTAAIRGAVRARPASDAIPK
jgi:hypothetical protein